MPGAKPRYARSFVTRPLLGRVSSWLSRLSALAEHGPDSLLSRITRRLSSPTCLLFFFAAIDPNPDYGSFVTGLEVITFTALVTVSVFMVIGFIRRKLGE